MKCLYCNCEFIPYEHGDGRQKFCTSYHQQLDWLRKNPERAKTIRKKTKAKHRDKIRESARKYSAEHKEQLRINLLAWRRKNKAKTVQQVLLRRYREKGAEGSHTLEQWEEIKKKYDFRCAICKEKKILTRDHIIPVTKKGSNDISNIQPLCRECNSRKFNHL